MSEKLARISAAEAKSPLFVGIDLGDSKIISGVVDDAGRPLSRTCTPRKPTKSAEEAALILALALTEAIKAAGVQPKAIAGMGLTTAGTIDAAVGERLSALSGIPVTQVNYVDALACAERWVGAARGFNSLVLLTLDAEIGCGIYLADAAACGARGRGQEFGHCIIDFADNARKCACGGRGHLAAYASSAALLARAQEAVDAGRKTSLAGKNVSLELIEEEATRGDAVALEIVMEAAAFLGVGIVNLLHTVDTSGILLAGPMTFGGNESDLGRRFLKRVQEEVAARAFALLAERTVIDFAALGANGGFVGAAGAARGEQGKGK